VAVEISDFAISAAPLNHTESIHGRQGLCRLCACGETPRISKPSINPKIYIFELKQVTISHKNHGQPIPSFLLWKTLWILFLNDFLGDAEIHQQTQAKKPTLLFHNTYKRH
jgi:hypothetical protein